MARAAKTAKGLTEKQERFAAAYFRTTNASEAYREAYQPKKMSAKHVANKASALLKRGDIRGRVAALRELAVGRTELIADRVRAEVARLSFSRISNCVNPDGTVMSVHQMSEDALAAVASLEVFEEYEGHGKDRKLVGHIKKLKLWDKNSALEKAMKHLGLFEKDNKQRADPTALLLQWLNDRDAAAGNHGLPVKY